MIVCVYVCVKTSQTLNIDDDVCVCACGQVEINLTLNVDVVCARRDKPNIEC